MKRGVKAKDHEKLDDANIQKVSDLLEADKPITKKEACEILNISYNTTRLKKIIEEYKDRIARRKARFEKNRGTALRPDEIRIIVEGFLVGQTISDISEMVARSPSIVNNVLDSHGVPSRPRGDDKHKYALLPEECVRESFSQGEIVWSARYHTSAEVIKLLGKTKDGLSNVYRVWVNEPSEMRARGGFYHSCAATELGSLEHLKDVIRLERIIS